MENTTTSLLQKKYPLITTDQPANKPDIAQWITELKYPPLEFVTKPNLTTNELAYYLNRRPQTIRAWACHEDGPLRPRRIGGLLAWATAEVKTLAGVTA